jgi:hypothetical protein
MKGFRRPLSLSDNVTLEEIKKMSLPVREHPPDILATWRQIIAI